ncbi:hypothetical protein BOS5A_201036 [Bosea sp. EC-HK365B]|nr:hypothetical protein BOSE21B_110987 [Bosea sp. 21B]CAD5275285.1 hypothetical protein BOSE7B_40228 [Bosea sp. 7B]VVT59169.1 hypothetical protein BOS5A_201036 [Bosea sp. EC-HK365B]VXC75202.1 hypothetical protein BOSE127_40403 [Bosea sp. 127]
MEGSVPPARFFRGSRGLYARMTAVSLDGGFDLSDDPVRGATTLETYVQKLATGPN